MHFHQSNQSRFLNASFNKRRSGNQWIRRALKIRGLRFTTRVTANQEPDNWTCGTDFWLRRNLALRLADSFFPRLVLAAVTRRASGFDRKRDKETIAASVSPLFTALYTNYQNGRYLRCRPRPQQGPRGLHRQGRQHQLHDGVAAPRQQVSSASRLSGIPTRSLNFGDFLLPGRAANTRRAHRSSRSRPRRPARVRQPPQLVMICLRTSASAVSRASFLLRRGSDCDPAGRRI